MYRDWIKTITDNFFFFKLSHDKIYKIYVQIGFFLNGLCMLLVYMVFPQESMSENCDTPATKRKFAPSKSNVMQTVSRLVLNFLLFFFWYLTSVQNNESNQT